MESSHIIILFSILLSAFFSGLEIAFVSANKLQVELEKKRDGLTARLLTIITNKPSKFITTMLVGNNIALVVYSYYMGEFLVGLLPIQQEFTLLLVQTLISTLLILVTAEFLPKAIFRVYANETLKFFVVPAYLFYQLFQLLSSLIEWFSNSLLKLFFNATEEELEKSFSKEELGYFIDKQLETTADSDEEVDSEIQIFQNALTFNTVKAREIMVHRTDIEAVDLHESVHKLSEQFVKTGMSKILVYKNSLDDIVGYVHAFELFKKPKQIRSVILPVEYVPESMMINDLLNLLTKKRKSVAIVIDEYGGTSGMVTIEDIVEELFGEIEDEHDNVDLLEKQLSDTEFEFSARLEVDYLNEEYNLNIPKSEAYETLGGFVIDQNEDIPEANEKIVMEGFEVQILKVSSTKIEELSLKVLPTD